MNFLERFLQLCILTSCFNCFLSAGELKRSIINGYDAPKRPFYVQLMMDEASTCGGTLIKDNWVLTAAHCLATANSAVAGIGDFTKKRPKLQFISGSMFVHQGYKMEMAANGREAESILDDIALVKLESPAPEKDVLPLCGDRNPRHYKLAAIGMGLNETWTNWATIVEKHNKGFAVFPDVLQEVKLKENSHCFDARPDLPGDPEKLICCYNSQNENVCKGDSGGPLVFVDKSNKAICLYGLTSYGLDGCLGGLSVFTRISKYMEWIATTISDNS